MGCGDAIPLCCARQHHAELQRLQSCHMALQTRHCRLCTRRGQYISHYSNEFFKLKTWDCFITPLRFDFNNGVKIHDPGCVLLPAPEVARCKTRLEYRVYHKEVLPLFH